jgi:hypothetical protein
MRPDRHPRPAPTSPDTLSPVRTNKPRLQLPPVYRASQAWGCWRPFHSKTAIQGRVGRLPVRVPWRNGRFDPVTNIQQVGHAGAGTPPRCARWRSKAQRRNLGVLASPRGMPTTMGPVSSTRAQRDCRGGVRRHPTLGLCASGAMIRLDAGTLLVSVLLWTWSNGRSSTCRALDTVMMLRPTVSNDLGSAATRRGLRLQRKARPHLAVLGLPLATTRCFLQKAAGIVWGVSPTYQAEPLAAFARKAEAKDAGSARGVLRFILRPRDHRLPEVHWNSSGPRERLPRRYGTCYGLGGPRP